MAVNRPMTGSTTKHPAALFGSALSTGPDGVRINDPAALQTEAMDRLKLAVRWLSSVKTIAPLRTTPHCGVSQI